MNYDRLEDDGGRRSMISPQTDPQLVALAKIEIEVDVTSND